MASTFDTRNTPAPYDIAFGAIPTLFTALAAPFTRIGAPRVTVPGVAHLSDRELTDIGLSRTSVHVTAFGIDYRA